MRYKHIANTELKPSCICLGTAEMGTAIGKEDSYRMLDTFMDAGGNIIDTALVYGNWQLGERSLSEKTIGQWLKDRKAFGKVMIATKGAHPELTSMNIPRLSRRDIEKDLDESLQNIGVESIDLFWLHRDDPGRPVGEIMESLNDMAAKGKIRYFGCSNWFTSRMKEAYAFAADRKMQFFKANQTMWSLAKPNEDVFKGADTTLMDDEMLQFHMDAGLAAFAFTSQARGFFSKIAGGDTSRLADWVKATYCNEENKLRLDRIQKISRDWSVSITSVVLGYLVSQPIVAIPVVGPQSMEQLHECIRAGDVVFPDKVVTFLDGRQ